MALRDSHRSVKALRHYSASVREIVRLPIAAAIFTGLGFLLAEVLASLRGGAPFPQGLFLFWFLFGVIFLLAGLAQWSRLGLRSYGVPPGQPWGAAIAAFGAPGLRRPSPLGPPLPWEPRRDASGRSVVFTASDGLIIGGILVALAFATTLF
jgi:Zn-dependent protease with chaperone function